VHVWWLQVASTVQYDKLLKGFQRVSLAPGESTTVTFTLEADDLAVLGLHAYSADHGCVCTRACVVTPRFMNRRAPPARIRMATGLLPSLSVLLLPW
jgi:hypothetical protein